MKRLIIIFLTLSFLLVFSGCSKKEIYPNAFYGEYANAQRNSYWNVSGLKELPKEVVWKHPLSDADEIFFITMATPTIDGDHAYLVNGGTSINCIEINTGKEIWKKSYSEYFSPFSEFNYSPVVYEDKLIVVEGFPAGEHLACINKNTGELLWKSIRIGDPQVNDTSEHPLVIDGKVYLAASNAEEYEKTKNAESGIWVWDINTGKVLDKIFIEPVAEPIVGKYRSMYPVSASLAQDGLKIYGITRFTNDSTYRTYIFSYDITKRKFTWFEPVGEEGFKSPGQRGQIAIYNNFIVVSMVGDQWGDPEPQYFIKVFDKISHKPLWQNISSTERKNNPVFTTSNIAIHDNKLYAMTMDKKLVCYDIRDGKEIWSYKDKDWESTWWNSWNKDGNIFREKGICVTNDVVYFNVSKAIYAFDTESGKFLWRKLVEKGYTFINMVPVNDGLMVRYQDYRNGYDMPQKPSVEELWK